MIRFTRSTLGCDVIVAVHGEIDLSTAPLLREELADACEQVSPPGRLIADLTTVDFMSSSGIAELVVAHEHCREHRTPLLVVADGPRVLRPLEITGLDRSLDIVLNLEDARRHEIA
jgi:anti-anti-sigma factor